jgi:hypothetical protein
MREFDLKSGDPLALTIAADPRFVQTNYVNDQIWELKLSGGEPAALALETTYGLRVRSMRLFPRFVEGNNAITDPNQFSSPPTLRRFYPNLLEIVFSPFPDIEVVLHYWAVRSEAVSGRIQVTSLGSTPREFRLEWSALLNPPEGNQLMVADEINSVPVLTGSGDGLTPVVFITGGAIAESSPFPALVLGLDLAPGKSRTLTWCHAACPTKEESYQLIQQIIQSNWEAAITRMELLNSAQVEVYTGDPHWDAAFALSQKTALGLFISADESLQHSTFVSARNPHNGYSLRGDGTDYGPLWQGQSILDTYYLADIILPVEPELVKGLIMNFLSTQSDNGEIDGKPGLAGYRSNRLAAPLLATLSLKYYQQTSEHAFLDQILDPLVAFFFSWFTPSHDRDKDGIPEWDHPLQAGIEDHPVFSRWHPWAQGVDITTVESPSLSSFLFRECLSLIKIAKILKKEDILLKLKPHADNLSNAVESAWDPRKTSYQYRDRDSHGSSVRKKLGELRGEGVIEIHQKFVQPVRLVVSINTSHETTRRARVFVHGTSTSGSHRVDRIPGEKFLWFPQWGTITSDANYVALEYIEIHGVGKDDQIKVHTAGINLQDLTNLFPLWAGIPEKDRAGRMIARTLKNPGRFWQRFGLTSCITNGRRSESDICQRSNLFWCLLIGEGLLAYGQRTDAAELVSRLMEGIIQSLKKESCFRQQYDAVTGQGFGEGNAVTGLAPLGLFLNTLGIHLISPIKVRVEGYNPFPWPVTIKYRGMTVLRGKEKTQVIFPDGQTFTSQSHEPQLIALE